MNWKYLLMLLALTSLLLTSCDDDDEMMIDVQAALRQIQSFDVSVGEQPLGIASLPDGNLAVAFPFLKQLRIYESNGTLVRTFENLPAFAGLAIDNNGKILAAAPAVLDPTFDPAVNPENNGIWRIDPENGNAEPLASFPDLSDPINGSVPRAIDVSDDGVIYLSDLLGRIYQIKLNGEVTTWSMDSNLAGDPAVHEDWMNNGRTPFPNGVNGIRVSNGFLYATNTDKGRLTRFPINNDGSAGPPEVLINEPELLLGLDDIEIKDNGDFVLLVAFLFELYEFDEDTRQLVKLFDATDGIDTPAGMTRGRRDADRDLFFTNLAFITNNMGGNAKPGLSKVENIFE